MLPKSCSCRSVHSGPALQTSWDGCWCMLMVSSSMQAFPKSCGTRGRHSPPDSLPPPWHRDSSSRVGGMREKG